MDTERLKEADDKPAAPDAEKAARAADDKSQQMRPRIDKADEPGYRGFSTGDDARRVDRVPVDSRPDVGKK
jgi:hypothetical protein